MMTREEKLRRIRAGLPLDDGNRKPSITRSVVGSGSVAVRAGGVRTRMPQNQNVEISDKAAQLIAKALKTLLDS